MVNRTTAPLIVFDQPDKTAQYGGGQWSINQDSRWMGGSNTWPDFANTNGSVAGTLNYTFTGVSVAFIGNTPGPDYSQNATITLDSNPSYVISYNDPSPQTYLQWYQSPTLDAGPHTIFIDGLAKTSVDYILVTPGDNTPVLGQTLLVDDTDSAIVYKGAWLRNKQKLFLGQNLSGFPYGNSTRSTSTRGDTATFHFTGSAVGVYGVFHWAAVGSITVTFTLREGPPDSGSPNPPSQPSQPPPSTLTFAATPSSPQAPNGYQFNFQLFATDVLQSGNHTLEIRLDDCTAGQELMLDYITYSPTFQNLASMPQVPFPDPQSSGSPLAIIVGTVVGGITLIASIGIAYVLWRRRRRNDSSSRRQPNFSLDHEPYHTSAGYTPVQEHEDLRRGNPTTGGFAFNQNTAATGTPQLAPLRFSSGLQLSNQYELEARNLRVEPFQMPPAYDEQAQAEAALPPKRRIVNT